MGHNDIAGIVEMTLARVWIRLRHFIPPESADLVIVLVETIILLAAVHVMLEDNAAGTWTAKDGVVAGCALAVMAASNAWNNGQLKLSCLVIGIVLGYSAVAATGLLTWHEFNDVAHRPLLAIPKFR